MLWVQWARVFVSRRIGRHDDDDYMTTEWCTRRMCWLASSISKIHAPGIYALYSHLTPHTKVDPCDQVYMEQKQLYGTSEIRIKRLWFLSWVLVAFSFGSVSFPWITCSEKIPVTQEKPGCGGMKASCQPPHEWNWKQYLWPQSGLKMIAALAGYWTNYFSIHLHFIFLFYFNST